MPLYDNILETIGNTPLVRFKKLENKYALNNHVYGKLESFNPSNNVKVRPAYAMIKTLIDCGVIKNDSIIVEATSGNTGISLAMVGAYFDLQTIIIMPEKVSKERIDTIKHYGATILLTPAEEGILGANKKAEELSKDEKVVIPSQFDNISNPTIHYQTTARELDNDLNEIDYIFIGVGTGGTISGVGKYFKEKKSNTKILAVEPENSKVLQGESPKPHKIAGISPGFIPKNYNPDVVDEVISVNEDDAWIMTKQFTRLEAVSIGISSGAVLKAMLDYVIKNQISNKNIVCIIPDSGEKYFSTGVFN